MKQYKIVVDYLPYTSLLVRNTNKGGKTDRKERYLGA